MEPESPRDALRAAVERLLAETEAARSRDSYRYAKTAAAAFEEISLLRARGVEYDKICGIFETTGWLPENSNVNSFRQAFAREKARRTKNGGNPALEAEKSGRKISATGTKPQERNVPDMKPSTARPSGILPVRSKAVGGSASLEVKPDNTFTIRPIDPDDLPES